MSIPPTNPSKTAAGITVDPRTLERVIPSSQRADGSRWNQDRQNQELTCRTRKQVKIRPGFTPEEDVGRFRSSRQRAADAARGHVPGSRPAAGRQLSDLVNMSSWSDPPASAKSTTSAAPNPKPKPKTESTDARPKKQEVKLDWTEQDLKETNFRWDDDSDDEDFRLSFAKVNLDDNAKQAGNGNAEKGGNGQGAGVVDQSPTCESGGAPVQGVSPAAVASDAQASPSAAATAATAANEPAPPALAGGAPETASEKPGAGPAPRSNVPTSPKAPRAPRNDWQHQQQHKPHPIQGGRRGPIGLAFPPPVSTEPPRPPVRQFSRSETADSWRSGPRPPPATPTHPRQQSYSHHNNPHPHPHPHPHANARPPPQTRAAAGPNVSPKKEANGSSKPNPSTAPAPNTSTADATKPTDTLQPQAPEDGFQKPRNRRRKKDRSAPNPTQGPTGPAQGSQAGSERASSPPSQPTQQPRVRKEVRVREGGANDGSLANRVRNLVLDNQNQGPRSAAPKEKAESTSTSTPAP